MGLCYAGSVFLAHPGQERQKFPLVLLPNTLSQGPISSPWYQQSSDPSRKQRLKVSLLTAGG